MSDSQNEAVKPINDVTLPEDISPDDFPELLEQTLVSFKNGDVIEGTVVRIDRNEVMVDVGYKSEGVIPSRELSVRKSINPNEVFNVGDKVQALVLEKEDDEGRLILSVKRAIYEKAWGDIQTISDQNKSVKGTVIESVKGGLIVDIGVRGFLPASLIDVRRVKELSSYVGEEVEAKILELDKQGNNIVLSRKAHLEEELSEETVTEETELEEEEKEEMKYVTKEEFALAMDELKSMIEKMGYKDKEEEMSKEEVVETKEELSAETVEPIKHNPEAETKNVHFTIAGKGTETTKDRVYNKIFNNN